MHGTKLDLLLKALLFLSQRLRACDRLSLVAFNHRAKCVTGLKVMNELGKRATAAAIRESWSLRCACQTSPVNSGKSPCINQKRPSDM